MVVLRVALSAWVFSAVQPCCLTQAAILEYHGQVASQGRPFHGVGAFGFAIAETNGVTWWQSGELPFPGLNTPLPHELKIPATNGAYSIPLGDPALGMPPLNSETLQRAIDPHLVVWFRDLTKGWTVITNFPIAEELARVGITSSRTTDIGTLMREFRELRTWYQRDHPKSFPPTPSPAPALTTVSIRNSPSLGRQDAPLVLVEFLDFECPFCKHAHGAIQELRSRFVDTGKLRLVARNLPMSFHPHAREAARAALCAASQHQFWTMHDQLFSISPNLAPGNLLKAAQALKLDLADFAACTSTNSFDDELKKDAVEALASGINGTPTFILGKADGEKVTGEMIVGAQTVQFFEQAIVKQLTEAAPK